MTRPRRILGAALLALGVAGIGSAPAHAASTITVSACDQSHLDAAVAQANTDNAGDTVKFSCSGTINVTSTLTISHSMTIDGTGETVTLDGGGSTGLLSVNSGVTLDLIGLTLSHGTANQGGAIFDYYGTVHITGSTFSDNYASGVGGAISTDGGAVDITASTFTGNVAGDEYGGGGAIFQGGGLNITGSTFSGNSATGTYGSGGALLAEATANITRSTFVNNQAQYGGAIESNHGTVSLSNSTLAGNAATAADSTGGAIDNYGGTLTVSSSTLSGNSAQSGEAISNNATMTLGTTIFANSTSEGNCSSYGTPAPVTDQGYNLDTDGTCLNGGTGDISAQDPLLGPLASNGGATQTMALGTGSPAIDQIPSNLCPASDQRGVTRPDGTETSCDIGAYEHEDQVTTSTALGSSSNPSVTGQTVTYTATVSPTPDGGTVAFSDGGMTITGCGSQAVNTTTGTATCSVTYTGTGSHSLTAAYSGDAAFRASDTTASPLSQTVNKADTSTLLTSNHNPLVVGQSVTYTATVAVTAPGAGNPSGSVDFYNTTTNSDLGTGTLAVVNGQDEATLTTSTLAVGAHSIKTTYAGDAGFLGSDNGANLLVQDVSYQVQQAASANKAGNLSASVQLQDYNGVNLSSSSIPVTAECIVQGSSAPTGCGTATSLNAPFTFNAKGHASGTYTYTSRTGLPSGTYWLVYQAGNDPILHSVSFTI